MQENWVLPGTRVEACVYPGLNHNTSCTVVITEEKRQEVIDYIWEHRNTFTALSFLTESGDKDYNQAPFTTVLDRDQIVEKYGDGAVLASGLIVDALHYFDNNLWQACDHLLNKDLCITGTKEQVLLRKYWLQRARKFSRNYFKGNHQQTVYCLKDVHLFHKWLTITRSFKTLDLAEILPKPEYKTVSHYAAMACSGGSCELTRID